MRVIWSSLDKAKMMKSILFSVVLLLIYSTFTHSTHAGQTNPTRKQKEENSKPSSAASKVESPDLLARLVGLLYSTAQDAKKWDDSASAARVQGQVADLTWDVDNYVARDFLLRAWTSARSIKDDQDNSPYFNHSLRAEIRRELILIARKRAPDLSEKWLTEMAQEVESGSKDDKRGMFDDRTERSSVLLTMAAVAVDQDPQSAAALAEESLRDGISFGLQNVLLALQKKDFSLARRVFVAAMSRLRSVGMSDPGELLILYSYFYTPGLVVSPNTSENSGSFTVSVSRNSSPITSAASLDSTLGDAFLRLASELLLRAPMPAQTQNPQVTARVQISAIQTILGEVSRRLPEEAALLKARTIQMERDAHFAPATSDPRAGLGVDPSTQSQKEVAEQYVSSLEERAKKEASPMGRNIMYARAALATSAERYERGLSLAEHIHDEKLRADLICFLRYRAAVHFALHDNPEKAYEINAGNTDLLQRAAGLVVGAQQLIKTKKIVLADQWLSEASSLTNKADVSESSSRVMLGVASAYAKFDDVAALAALSSAVKLINKSAALSLDDRAPLVLRFTGLEFADFTYSTSGFGLKSVISSFGVNNFDKFLDNFREIRSPEFQGLAAVLLCEKYLQSVPETVRRSQ
jgi:hypothetical protein